MKLGTFRIFRIQDGGREKLKKLRYLRNLLTDFDKICFADGYWPTGHYRAKHSNF